MTGKRGFSQLPKGKKRRIYSAAFVVVLAAEVAIGLALIVAMFRSCRSVDSASLNTLKD